MSPHLTPALVLAASVLAGLIAWGLGDVAFRLPYAIHARVVLFTVASLLVSTLFMKKGPRTRARLFTITLALSLFAAEGYLAVNSPLAQFARPEGYDYRERSQVLLDLRAEGREMYPPLQPAQLLPRGLDLGRETLLPFSGPSQSWILHCNENGSGSFTSYRSDEHGFPNPRGLWDGAPLDVAFVGDSFTHGACHLPGYADQVRDVYPRTLNLGSSGNGPLIELATLREFLPDLKPRTVVWCYYEGNDAKNLQRELGIPQLMAYLDPGHRQGLREKQALIDRRYKARVSRTLEKAEANPPPTREAFKTRHLGLGARAQLTLLRETLHRALNQDPAGREHHSDEELFSRILGEAKGTVESWGGELIFVYLTSYGTLLRNQDQPSRQTVLRLVSEHGLRLVDTRGPFEALEDPLSIFPFGQAGHYEAEGVRLVAELVLGALAEGP